MCHHQAPSHYQNQWWLIISEVLWHSAERNLTENARDICSWLSFEKPKFKSNLPETEELKKTHSDRCTLLRWRATASGQDIRLQRLPGISWAPHKKGLASFVLLYTCLSERNYANILLIHVISSKSDNCCNAFSLMEALQVIEMTTCDVSSDVKVGIIRILGFQLFGPE